MGAMNKLLTEDEAAEMLRISARSLAGLRKDGQIAHLRVSRCVRYEPQHLEDFRRRSEVLAREKSAPRYGYRGAGVHSDRNYQALAGIV